MDWKLALNEVARAAEIIDWDARLSESYEYHRKRGTLPKWRAIKQDMGF
jgi:hypothetical protein